MNEHNALLLLSLVSISVLLDRSYSSCYYMAHVEVNGVLIETCVTAEKGNSRATSVSELKICYFGLTFKDLVNEEEKEAK